MRKEFFYSKTFWVNVIALVAIVIQSYTDFVIAPEAQASILVLINLVLRAITGDEITFGGKSFVK
jgi:hypothetical protein